MLSSPERHVLTGHTPPPSHLHIRLLCKLHCITQFTPELPNTCTITVTKEEHILYRLYIQSWAVFVFVGLNERLLLVKNGSSLGFVPRELMSLGAEWCQSAAAQLKITGQHWQHLLTWIHCKDKQTVFALSVNTGFFFLKILTGQTEQPWLFLKVQQKLSISRKKVVPCLKKEWSLFLVVMTTERYKYQSEYFITRGK